MGPRLDDAIGLPDIIPSSTVIGKFSQLEANKKISELDISPTSCSCEIKGFTSINLWFFSSDFLSF